VINMQHKAVLRVADGDHGLQAVTELACYYVRVMQQRSERYEELQRDYWEDVLEIYCVLKLDEKYGLPTSKYWRVEGSRTKSDLIYHILDREYPKTEIETLLTACGLDVLELGRYSYSGVQRQTDMLY